MLIGGRRNNSAKSKTNRTSTAQSELFSRIQRKAYELYEKRGYSHGNDWSDWFEAERLVRREFSRR